ncbi:hypothetical protein [Haloferula sp. BvORR071]|uniref:hypothetical protein n=1 Tax=Haloferula sp. BvORR071 TaxID=1396141 RepID=UPI000556427E|nr:hypothetical protein [Haloferula sp. BvORR071]
MFYVLQSTTVTTVSAGFSPFEPSRWAPGQIVHFSTEGAARLKGRAAAILAGLSGDAWQIEILTSASSAAAPRFPSPPGIIVRLLKRRPVDDAITTAIRDYAARIPSFSPAAQEAHSQRGAA